MVGKRRTRFVSGTQADVVPSGRSPTSRGKGISDLNDSAVQKGRRGFQRSGGRSSIPQGLGSGRNREERGGFQGAAGGAPSFPPRRKGSGRNPTELRGGTIFPRRRTPQRPTNPHDPKSKDPFMRAGMGLGTNDTKIFGRAGMSMDLKKMRKMF